MTGKIYDVTIYATVRVKVEGITGVKDHAEAMERAQRDADLDKLLARDIGRRVNGATIAYTAYAEEITGFLIDEQGDIDYERSRCYDGDGDPSLPTPKHPLEIWFDCPPHGAVVRDQLPLALLPQGARITLKEAEILAGAHDEFRQVIQPERSARILADFRAGRAR